MTVAWSYLALAIAVEVCATLALNASDGFEKPIPTVGSIVGYAISFFFLARSLKAGMEVSIAYAIWSGVGTAAIALVAAAFLDEPLTALKVVGIGLVILGIVLVEVQAE